MTVLRTESINPLDLPSVALKEKNQLPEIASIYFVISEKDEILYIGRTVNLKQRWATHHRLTEFLSQHETAKVSWIEVQEVNLLSSLEKSMISHFKPNLNGKRIAHLIDVSEDFTMQELEIEVSFDKHKPLLERKNLEDEDKVKTSDSPFVSEYERLLAERGELLADFQDKILDLIHSLKLQIIELEKQVDRVKVFEKDLERLKEVEKEYERLKMWRDSVLAITKIVPN